MHASYANAASTWWAALVFAAILLWGHRIRLLSRIGMDGNTIISFGAGMGAAYVFVHVMPELSALRKEFVESISMTLRFEGMVIYFVALAGFLFFFGLDHWRKGLVAAEAGDHPGYGVHVGGFAIYVALISYIVVELPDHAHGSTALFVVAMALHFLAVDHALSEEHKEAYDNRGRYIMAAIAVAGWCVGVVASAPVAVEAMLLAFVSGGVMVNSMIAEVSSQREGRFMPFVLGSLAYGLLLLPLG
jgi:hypothetical protein